MKTDPKISVVTVVFNDKKRIARTIQSTISQDYSNLEYIVIDGNSVDGTKNVIEKYRLNMDRYISEPDKGIYDAMNKGADLASGEWIVFMNAGDLFYSKDSVSKISKYLKKDTSVVCAGCKKVLTDELETRTFDVKPEKLGNLWKRLITAHQAIVTRVDLQRKYGFDTKYTWCADQEMFLRMYRDGKNFKLVNETFCIFDANGAKDRETDLYIKERWRISKNYAPLFKRVLQFGSEWVHDNIWGKMVAILKKMLPSSWILKLRRIRKTDK